MGTILELNCNCLVRAFHQEPGKGGQRCCVRRALRCTAQLGASSAAQEEIVNLPDEFHIGPQV